MTASKLKYLQSLERLKSSSSSATDFDVALEQRSLQTRHHLIHEQWPAIRSQLEQCHDRYKHLTQDYERWMTSSGFKHNVDMAALDPAFLLSAMERQMQARSNLDASDPELKQEQEQELEPNIHSLLHDYMATLKEAKTKLHATLCSNRLLQVTRSNSMYCLHESLTFLCIPCRRQDPTLLPQARTDFSMLHWLTPYAMTEDEASPVSSFRASHRA